MTDSQSTAVKKSAIAVGAVVIVAAAVYAVAFRGDENKSTLPPELQPEAIQAKAEKDPGSVFRTIRETMDRDDLTEEQRRELRQNMRESFERMMDERVDEYFAAAEDKREEVLDRHIDEFQKRMEQWRKDREEWEKERAKREKERSAEGGGDGSGSGGGGGNEAKAGSGGGSGPGSGDRGRDGGRRGWRSRFRESTPSERKKFAESHDPDKMARRMSYFGAMMKRASERGIQMPGPGGRGRRGGGRGR